VLLTVFCIWAAIHGQWVRDRRDARAWIVEHEHAINWSAAAADDVRIGKWTNGRQVWTSAAEVVPAMPWGLRAFGDQRLYFIHLDKSKLNAGDVARINSLQALFPEADGVHIEGRDGDRWPPADLRNFFEKFD